jgi:hypothetical protein
MPVGKYGIQYSVFCDEGAVNPKPRQPNEQRLGKIP